MDTIKTYGDRQVRISAALADCLTTLEATRAGGFAFLRGAIFESGRMAGKATVANVWFSSRFSYAALLERKERALDALTGVPGLSEDAFSTAKEALLASARQTLMGDRSGAAREAHDRCYVKVAEGVYIHLDTTEGADGKKMPILTDGLPTAESILVQALEIKRQVIEPGEKKPVKSRPETLAKRAVERAIFAQGVREPRRYTLKPGRFEALSIDNSEITEEAVTEED